MDHVSKVCLVSVVSIFEKTDFVLSKAKVKGVIRQNEINWALIASKTALR
jgi:hypothetical protein